MQPETQHLSSQKRYTVYNLLYYIILYLGFLSSVTVKMFSTALKNTFFIAIFIFKWTILKNSERIAALFWA